MNLKVPSRKDPKKLFTVAGLAGQAFYDKHANHVYLLGAISVQWSTLEKLLFDIFRVMAMPDRSVAEVMFYALPTHHMRRNLVRRLTEEMVANDQTRGSLLKILDDIKVCAERRNSLFHDTWVVTDAGSIQRMRAGAVRKGEGDIFNEPFEPLIEFHRKLARINESLMLAIFAVVSDRNPSARKPIKRVARERKKKIG